ncbi:ParB/RepB/Spo0J family partition protein [Legionella shakespearei]|nr:ParB/RepB/Spo0J family partition protein [Legionella shakespearei]
MMQNFCLSDVILERFQNAEIELGNSEHIVKLDCEKIDTWVFRDRKPFELGDIDQLAMSINHGGQCQPIIVVKASEVFKPKDNPNVDYVVIAGYRRWMACKKYDLKVQAIVRNITFEQAITVLVSENEKENVSDYSKGMFYNTLLNTEEMSPEILSERLNINLSTLNMYLSFAQVPIEIWNAVGDISRVSARTAAVINQIASKGTMYIEALMAIAKKISHGYGEKRIRESVNNIIDKQLKRIHQVLDHKLKFNGKTIMSVHQGRMKFDDSLVNHKKYGELIEKLEKDITDFANFYLNESKH